MKLRTLLAAAILLGAVGFAIAEDESADDPTAAVLQANEQFYAALNAMFQGDLEPMDAVWSHADDVTYLPPDGEFLVGWEATRKDWQKQAAMKLGGKVTPQEVRVTIGKELAVVQDIEHGQNTIDDKTTAVKIRATNVYRLENDTWKMISHHTDRLSFLEN